MRVELCSPIKEYSDVPSLYKHSAGRLNVELRYLIAKAPIINPTPQYTDERRFNPSASPIIVRTASGLVDEWRRRIVSGKNYATLTDGVYSKSIPTVNQLPGPRIIYKPLEAIIALDTDVGAVSEANEFNQHQKMITTLARELVYKEAELQLIRDVPNGLSHTIIPRQIELLKLRAQLFLHDWKMRQLTLNLKQNTYGSHSLVVPLELAEDLRELSNSAVDHHTKAPQSWWEQAIAQLENAYNRSLPKYTTRHLDNDPHETPKNNHGILPLLRGFGFSGGLPLDFGVTATDHQPAHFRISPWAIGISGVSILTLLSLPACGPNAEVINVTPSATNGFEPTGTAVFPKPTTATSTREAQASATPYVQPPETATPETKPFIPPNSPPEFDANKAVADYLSPTQDITDVSTQTYYRALFSEYKRLTGTDIVFQSDGLAATNPQEYMQGLDEFARNNNIRVILTQTGSQDTYQIAAILIKNGSQIRWIGDSAGGLGARPDIPPSAGDIQYYWITINGQPVFQWGKDGNLYLFVIDGPGRANWFNVTKANGSNPDSWQVAVEVPTATPAPTNNPEPPPSPIPPTPSAVSTPPPPPATPTEIASALPSATVEATPAPNRPSEIVPWDLSKRTNGRKTGLHWAFFDAWTQLQFWTAGWTGYEDYQQKTTIAVAGRLVKLEGNVATIDFNLSPSCIDNFSDASLLKGEGTTCGSGKFTLPGTINFRRATYPPGEPFKDLEGTVADLEAGVGIEGDVILINTTLEELQKKDGIATFALSVQ